jgi:hypothetical protein
MVKVSPVRASVNEKPNQSGLLISVGAAFVEELLQALSKRLSRARSKNA